MKTVNIPNNLFLQKYRYLGIVYILFFKAKYSLYNNFKKNERPTMEPFIHLRQTIKQPRR